MTDLTHQDRMRVELVELELRTERLRAFILHDPHFGALLPQLQSLTRLQLEGMTLYRQALRDRVDHLSKGNAVNPVSYISRFAVGEAVLYEQTPAHVVAVIFTDGKVRYDVSPDEDISLVHERVDSCDVHPLAAPAIPSQQAQQSPQSNQAA